MTKQILIVIMSSFLDIEQEAVLIAITLFFFYHFLGRAANELWLFDTILKSDNPGPTMPKNSLFVCTY